MAKTKRKARSVHKVLLPIWTESYVYIYRICTGSGKPSISYTLNEIIRQWVENDKKKKGL